MLGGLVMGLGKSANKNKTASHKLNPHGSWFQLSIKAKFSTDGQTLTIIDDIKGLRSTCSHKLADK
jgi:hypothetical protein